MQIAMTMANATASTKPTMLLKVTFSIESVPLKVRRPAKTMPRKWPPGNRGRGAHLAEWLAAPAGLWSDPARPKPWEPAPMAFEDLKAELALLINQMENQP